MTTVEVFILGQKYTVRGDGSPEHIKEIARFVDEKMREVYASAHNATQIKAAIIAALNISDELYKLKEEYDKIVGGISNLDKKTDSMIRLLE
ncbi:MAG: cell division protein ZapA [Nitrospirae bacterium]|nr:cell division protein ZapA [Nitrospirota bacterium]